MFFFNNSRGTSIEVEIANVVNFFEFVKCELKKLSRKVWSSSENWPQIKIYGTIAWNIFDDWGKVYNNITDGIDWRCVWLGESTLGGARLLSYCIVFERYHVWTSTISWLWRIFTMFLHIIVGQNPKKSNAKKSTFLKFHMMWCSNIFEPKMYVTTS